MIVTEFVPSWITRVSTGPIPSRDQMRCREDLREWNLRFAYRKETLWKRERVKPESRKRHFLTFLICREWVTGYPRQGKNNKQRRKERRYLTGNSSPHTVLDLRSRELDVRTKNKTKQKISVVTKRSLVKGLWPLILVERVNVRRNHGR